LPKFNPAKPPKFYFETRHSPPIHAKCRNLAITPDVIPAYENRRKSTYRSLIEYDLNKRMRLAMITLRRSLTAVAVAATLAVAAVAAPQPAEARGGRIAAGIIGGLAAGAILGGIAANNGYYGPGYGYYAAGPGYYYGPRCYWSRERVWDGYAWRRARVCD
jgi:hypothetical protein